MTAVLFDVDGTLVDTPGGMTVVLRRTVEEFGRDIDEDVLRGTVGRPLAASFAALLGLPTDHPDVPRAADRARALFTELVIPKARDLVYPGIRELLARLRSDGRKLAVVTSKIRRSAIEMLDAADLTPYFHTLSCHGMAERGKPHPDLALLAADALGVPAGECVVVGDAVDDVLMATAAGMDCVGVTTGVGTEADLRAAGARTVVPDATALAATLLADSAALR